MAKGKKTIHQCTVSFLRLDLTNPFYSLPIYIYMYILPSFLTLVLVFFLSHLLLLVSFCREFGK